MRHTAPTEVVQRYLDEVLGGHDPASADELVEDATLLRRVAVFREAFPDVRVRTNLVVAHRDLVGVATTARGTHVGPFHGSAPTGRQWSAPSTGLFRVSGGRIVDHWVTWDLLGILEQIGAVRRVDSGHRH